MTMPSGREMIGTHRVAACTGLAVAVDAGQHITVIDVEGGQVGDFFAYVRPELSEHLSASHTRAFNSRLFPTIGECFVSSRRREILRVLADSSPGEHDLLIAACDPARYEQFGAPVDHPSCATNLEAALEAFAPGRVARPFVVPQPFNIFMRTPAGPDGRISWLPATSRAGDRFEMEALVDLVVVVSACPSELAGINSGQLSDLLIEIGPPPV